MIELAILFIVLFIPSAIIQLKYREEINNGI